MPVFGDDRSARPSACYPSRNTGTLDALMLVMTSTPLTALSDSDARSLANAVNAAVRRAPSAARFCGGRKVFVAPLLDIVGYAVPGGAAASLESFKLRLVELNRRGLIALVRFDLAGAHCPLVEAASEIRHLNASFHCVVDATIP